jgi:hypothetical protein
LKSFVFTIYYFPPKFFISSRGVINSNDFYLEGEHDADGVQIGQVSFKISGILVILPSPFKLPNFKGVSFINVHL